jgi:3-keto-disaccharide hydrolase
MRLRPFCYTLVFLTSLSATAVTAPVKKEPLDSTLGAKPPEGAVVLFNGESLARWVGRDGKKPATWPVADGNMTVKGGDIMTTGRYGDFQLHVEFNVPYMPKARGQGRGNSGVYLGGIHELQVLDSYGLKLQDNDCGAIYKQIVPAVNACKPPLQWQTYDVTFHKAVVQDGKVMKKARLTVVQNGLTIIDNAEISPTPGGIDLKEGDDGPILLQDHGNAVEYRNIWLKPLN